MQPAGEHGLTRRRVVVAFVGACLATGPVYMAVFAVPPLITTFVDDLGFSHTQAGLLMASFLAAYAVCSLVSGHVVDRIGATRSMAIGLFICAVATVTFPITSSLGPMLVQRAGIGIGAALVYAPGLRYITALVPPRRASSLLGLYLSSLSVGITIVFFATPRIEDAIGWRWPFVIYGLVLFAAVLIFVATTFSTERHLKTEVSSAQMVSFARLFENRGLVLVFVALFVGMFTTYGVYTWIPPFLEEEAGFSVDQVSNATMLLALVGVPAVILAGWLIDRLRRPIGVAGAGFVLALIVVVLAITDQVSFEVATAVAVVASFGISGGLIPLFALPTTIVEPAAVARAAGVATFAAQTGGIVSTYLGGFIIGAADGYTEVFVMYTLAALATAAVVLPAAAFAIRRGSPALASHVS